MADGVRLEFLWGVHWSFPFDEEWREERMRKRKTDEANILIKQGRLRILFISVCRDKVNGELAPKVDRGGCPWTPC